MNWPWAIQPEIDDGKVRAVIFVDDFLGTGNQFCEFVTDLLKSGLDPQVKWIYAPVVAHEEGIRKVSKEFPSVEVVPIETIGSEHSFFNPDYWRSISNDTITAGNALDFYESFLRQRKFSSELRSPSRGYGDLSLCFGFEHATPDNTLPIFWHSGSTWTNLLQR